MVDNNQDVKPKVSIISPCYNGEKYIERMLESILAQSYKNIELICVNDGSTDCTEEILQSYVHKFTEGGMSLLCISQDNLGQAAAINNGLKRFSGEFLSWIDCDDYLTPDSVEKKLNILLHNPEYAIVTSNVNVVCENKTDKVLYSGGEGRGHLNYQANQFHLTLIGLSIMESHCHMIRVSDMRKINPSMEISICREGQNYQILLPMYYHYKRYYIDEPLAIYVVREDSHYHRPRSHDEWIQRYDALNQMLRETFQSMQMPEWMIEEYLRISVFTSEKRRYLEEHG